MEEEDDDTNDMLHDSCATRRLEDENRRLKYSVADSQPGEGIPESGDPKKTGAACRRAEGRGVRLRAIPGERTSGLQAAWNGSR
jgi:hypothetical protein